MSKEVEITSYFAAQSKLDPRSFPIGIGDDMAQVRLGKDCCVLVTTDMLLEGTHFTLEETTLEQVGYKAMAVNLSDCAAMATMPVAAVCAVGIPHSFGQDKLRELHRGITRAADMFDCPLIGGDITSWSNPLSINITMLSRPVGPAPVKRSTARPGDVICVTGSLGGSLKGRHLEFVPRVSEAIKLANLVELHSMMDISDGLSTDLGHICRLSCVGAIVDAASVPISDAAGKTADPLGAALNDGEDFELLFTLSPDAYNELASNWQDELKITRAGQVTAQKSMLIRMPDGSMIPLEPKGYDHLST